MNQHDDYQDLVSAFYETILNPEEETYLIQALNLASTMDKDTVEQAKREASVMSVMDSQFQA